MAWRIRSAGSSPSTASSGNGGSSYIAGITLASASTLDDAIRGAEGDKTVKARQVGSLLAQRASEAGITAVVFDRGGYAYHGRVAALADGAREGGLAL